MEAPASSPAPSRGKTALCKHRGSCMHNALSGFLKGAGIGAGLSAAIFLLSALASGKLFRNPSMIRKIISGDFFRYAGFLSWMAGGYKAALCMMRRFCSDDKKNSAVAGLLCSLGLLLMKGETKKTWALYLFVRALVSVHASAVQHGYFPKVPYGVFYLFASVCAILLYSRAFEPESLSKSYYNFTSYVMGGSLNDSKMLEIFGTFYRSHTRPKA